MFDVQSRIIPTSFHFITFTIKLLWISKSVMANSFRLTAIQVINDDMIENSGEIDSFVIPACITTPVKAERSMKRRRILEAE